MEGGRYYCSISILHLVFQRLLSRPVLESASEPGGDVMMSSVFWAQQAGTQIYKLGYRISLDILDRNKLHELDKL